MLQAVEAIIKEGRIQPIEPIALEGNARFLLVRLQLVPAEKPCARHAGSAKGRLVIHQDDDDYLADFAEYMA